MSDENIITRVMKCPHCGKEQPIQFTASTYAAPYFNTCEICGALYKWSKTRCELIIPITQIRWHCDFDTKNLYD